MKAHLRGVACATLALMVMAPAAQAGGGGMSGGSLEYTQILNNVQLVEAEVTRGVQLVQAVLQTESMLKNLLRNPMGVLAPDVARLASSIARTMAMGKEIAGTMADVDLQFAQTFNNPTAATYGAKFRLWSDTSMNALKIASANAGLQHEEFASDGAQLQALAERIAGADGNLAALHALGAINAHQVTESMKLRDLLGKQHQAQNIYLASATSKEQARQTNVDKLAAPYTKPIPLIEPGTFQPIKWR